MNTAADSLGLGIDAGGTFTDGAVVDLRTGTVLAKSKTPTLKDDLPGSIRRCLDGLDFGRLSELTLVSLSTTFATNAIVEGKGARAGALLLGYDSYDMAKVEAAHKVPIIGRHDIRGREMEPLDTEGVRAVVRDLVNNEHVEALAISGMGGVLNPAHEIAACEIARSETDVPVVCGHELSMELDAIRRANTAYFNARLLPVVVDLIRAVEGELRGRGINAPLTIVRSDGSLMSASEALSHPIHTIFSGPAASAVGALCLSGARDAVVVDIGGTTTDILTAKNGAALLSEHGSSVNGLRLSIPSVLGHTVGFGGDSHVRRDTFGQVSIGPERVIPIAVLAHASDSVTSELKRLVVGSTASSLQQPVEFYAKGWASADQAFSLGERRILDALADGPKSAEQLSSICGCEHPSLLPVEGLVRSGRMMRSGLTPTDVLHVVDGFRRWNAEAASLAVELYAADLSLDESEFCERTLEESRSLLAEELLCAALGVGNRHTRSSDLRDISRAIVRSRPELVSLRAQFSLPVIGIGASVGSYLPDACRAFGMSPLIPEHAEVANAVGAVAGRIAITTKAVVSPLTTGGFSVRTPTEHREFTEIEEAEDHAGRSLRAFLTQRINEDYEGFAFRYDIRTERRHARSGEGEVLVESTVLGTAVCTAVPPPSKG